MLNFWVIAAGAMLVAVATAVLRGSRRADGSLTSPPTSVTPVSDEWLSNARGKDELHP
jgi:hypothetical protein